VTIDQSHALPACALADLQGAVGPEAVSTDRVERQLRSQDVFLWDEAPLVDAVVRPGSAAEVAAVLRVAGAHGLAVAPRGGGVSYTKGYVPAGPRTISLDLGRLNQVLEINAADRYATVGAACTWERLAAALRPLGLRAAVRGPISGGVATIGGVASQNTGSASMAGYLSLEVVLADGSIVHTGSAARAGHPSPFFRPHGPNPTGLFLGDTGAYGIKTRCTLALEPIPTGVAFASLAFGTLAGMTEVMLAISRSGIPCRQMGMDPLKNRTATKVGLREGLSTLANVVRSAGSVGTGLRQAAGIAAAGQSVLAEVPWSLHVTVEGHDQDTADRALSALKALWSGRGREIAPSVPIALHARPFSIRGMLGIGGERWLPIHGIFPFSRAAEVV
jgi:FAD/FMN-containing dehydrogenase